MSAHCDRFQSAGCGIPFDMPTFSVPTPHAAIGAILRKGIERKA